MNVAAVLAVVLAALLVASAAFVVDPGGGTPEPVAFEDTAKTGMTAAETAEARVEGYVVPQAQVFYTGYRYVVGYYGIGPLVDELQRPAGDRPFGAPLVIYVRDFAGSGVALTDEGYLTVPDAADPAWVDATEAFYVVGSEARTPAGPAVVPFSSRAAAASFARDHGGRVVDWRALRELEFGTEGGDRDALLRAVQERGAWADRTVEAANALTERPTSTVVGEDAPTLAAAVDAAPPNTTVLVPAGTYPANLTVDKPVTIRGVAVGVPLQHPDVPALRL
ncbi:MAG TPA: nitrous oxide reductase accessory protein NosL, partial [Halobacteriales archaeon]|nr:nitrous oxide reductase accessory protein NosL [Halobacteriales archaeon]